LGGGGRGGIRKGDLEGKRRGKGGGWGGEKKFSGLNGWEGGRFKKKKMGFFFDDGRGVPSPQRPEGSGSNAAAGGPHLHGGGKRRGGWGLNGNHKGWEKARETKQKRPLTRAQRGFCQVV